MTNTKRVTGVATASTTSRVVLTSTVSKTARVSGIITADNTIRVPQEHSLNSVYDPWGGSWFATWGQSWLVRLALGSIGHSARVTAVPSGGQTKRVTGI